MWAVPEEDENEKLFILNIKQFEKPRNYQILVPKLNEKNNLLQIMYFIFYTKEDMWSDAWSTLTIKI
jgi:hypothetical protein